jgi:hypothetical protein
MKRSVFIVITLIFVLSLASAVIAPESLAQTDTDPSKVLAPPRVDVSDYGKLKSFLQDILTIMQTILFAMAGIFTVIAGFQYLTAQGETDKTTSARHSILYAVFAVGAGLLATVISLLIQNLLGVDTPLDPYGS